MLDLMPSDDQLYAALCARDAAYEGRAFVGVTSTGIVCRLTCPARKPRRENTRFFATLGEALAAGFRPCKRCRPEALSAEPLVEDLLARLDEAPDRRWRENDLVRLGFDPSTVRRAFLRQTGTTFLALARARRMARAAAGLKSGEKVIGMQIDAGYESASGFRDAFTRLMGQPPAAFAKDATAKADVIDTPLGPMIAIADDARLHLLEFNDRRALPTEMRRLWKTLEGDIGFGRTVITEQIAEELARYFAGEDAGFAVPVAEHGSAFTRSVWEGLRQIPVGKTASYKDLAAAIGNPAAVRAVARANGANQIAIVIPCHRCIGSDGSPTGYAGGLWRKQWLLDHERRAATRP